MLGVLLFGFVCFVLGCCITLSMISKSLADTFCFWKFSNIAEMLKKD